LIAPLAGKNGKLARFRVPFCARPGDLDEARRLREA
jgi:hypothetical protein